MRRLIITFLLALLPLQFAFASAAGYCGLDEAKAPSHFGHHDHSGSAPVADTKKDVDTGSVDIECGICHLGCAQPQPHMPDVATLPAVILAGPFADDPAPDHPQEPSERPPRASLA